MPIDRELSCGDTLKDHLLGVVFQQIGRMLALMEKSIWGLHASNAPDKTIPLYYNNPGFQFGSKKKQQRFLRKKTQKDYFTY